MRRDYLSLSGGGLASKLLGLVREVLLARFFGTGHVADAYRGAFSLTLSPVHLLTSRVVQACFIPLYARYAAENIRKAQFLFHSLLFFFTLLGILLGAALIVFAEPLVRIVLSGFDEERARLTVQMLKIMSFGVPFYIYCSLLGAVGAAQKHFLIPSVRPALQNLGLVVMIGAAVVAGKPVLAAFGFTGSYLILSVWATILLRKRDLLPGWHSIDRTIITEVLSRLWILARPLLLLSVLIECNILIERYVSSRLGPGCLAAVDYARFVTETVHFLVAVPLGLMGLSIFANLTEEENRIKSGRTLALLLTFMLPVSIFLSMNGDGVLSLLYLRGSFDQSSLNLTSRAMICFSAGLWVFSSSFMLQRILNARLRNRAVLVGETISIVLNVTFNLLMYKTLGILVVGLGLAIGSSGSFLFYLSRIRPSGRAMRSACFLLLPAVPLYALAAWGARFLPGEGVVALLLQAILAVFFWGAAARLQPDLWELIREKTKRNGP